MLCERWVDYLTYLGLCVLIYKMKKLISTFLELLGELNGNT